MNARKTARSIARRLLARRRNRQALPQSSAIAVAIETPVIRVPARSEAMTASVALAETDWRLPKPGELTGAEIREHKTAQVQSALRFLVIRSFGTLVEHGLDDTIQCAANILRAGIGGSPLELLHGRYV